MHSRLVLRLLILVATGWGITRLIESAPPEWQTLLTALPPVIISLLLAFMFGASLYRGEALVTRIARCEQPGGLPDELLRYTRRLTAVWAFYMLGSALASALLAQHIPVLYLASLPPALAACLVGGEYLYRKWRYCQYSHKNPLALMLFLIQHGFPTR